MLPISLSLYSTEAFSAVALEQYSAKHRLLKTSQDSGWPTQWPPASFWWKSNQASCPIWDSRVNKQECSSKVQPLTDRRVGSICCSIHSVCRKRTGLLYNIHNLKKKVNIICVFVQGAEMLYILSCYQTARFGFVWGFGKFSWQVLGESFQVSGVVQKSLYFLTCFYIAYLWKKFNKLNCEI